MGRVGSSTSASRLGIAVYIRGIVVRLLGVCVAALPGVSAGWTAPAALSPNATSDASGDVVPHVATDGQGSWVTVWSSGNTANGTQGGDTDIHFSRSVNQGATWSPPRALNTTAEGDTGGDRYPQVAVGSAGRWIAVWCSSENLGGLIGSDFDLLISKSDDGGQSWSAPQVLNSDAATDNGNEYVPQIGTDGQGNWVVVWESNTSSPGPADYDMFYSWSADNGNTWSPAAHLNSNWNIDSGHDYYPRLATDRQGNWIAAWYSTDSLGDTIGTDTDVLYCRSTDQGRTWSPVAALNANAALDSGGDGSADLCFDGAGTWLAAWSSSENLGGLNGSDGELHYALSTDSGASWSFPKVLNRNATSDSAGDYFPRILPDGPRAWSVVWYNKSSTGDTGPDRDILFARTEGDADSWSVPVYLNSAGTDSGEDISPEMAQDIQGNKVVVWYSNDPLQGTGTDNDILFVRTGTPPAATAIGLEQRTRITSAGGGHQVLTYYYSTGATAVSPYADNSSTVSYALPPDNWIGLYLYDYAAAAFTTASYKVLKGL